MLSLIDTEPTRTVAGLGLIQNRMTTELGQTYAMPTLVGASPGLSCDSDTPTIDFGLGADGAPVAAVMIAGIASLAIGIAGIGYGAYKGAQHSPGWAAGGALIGMVVAGLAQMAITAAVGAAVVG